MFARLFRRKQVQLLRRNFFASQYFCAAENTCRVKGFHLSRCVRRKQTQLLRRSPQALDPKIHVNNMSPQAPLQKLLRQIVVAKPD